VGYSLFLYQTAAVPELTGEPIPCPVHCRNTRAFRPDQFNLLAKISNVAVDRAIRNLTKLGMSTIEHGAGAQRADPKAGNPFDYPRGFGPQGDDVRIANYVRCVRG
jgi:hypothetical protein